MNNITTEGLLDLAKLDRIEADPRELARHSLNDGDFVYNTRNTPDLVGKSAVYHGEGGILLFNNNILRIKFDARVNPDYVNWVLNSPAGKKKIKSLVDGTTSVAALYQRNFEKIEIPLPPLNIQQAMVSEIEAELALVAASRDLVTHFEKKIEQAVARIWGGAEEVGSEEATPDG